MRNVIVPRRIILYLPAYLLIFLDVPSVSTLAVAKNVSFCDLAKNPKRFNNQEITVTAQYESDGVEREGLSDSTCKESGVALEIARDAKGTDQLRAALHGGYPGTLDKTVIGTFNGIFHWLPENHPPRVLSVRSMQGFSVHQKPVPFKVQQ
jgi:hypothetical protein